MAVSNITIRAVQALKPGENIWDADHREAVRGFGVRRQRDQATYVLKYRVFGRQRFVTIGPHGAPWTPELARKEAKRLLGLVANGKDPADEKAKARGQSGLENFHEVRSVLASGKPKEVTHPIYQKLNAEQVRDGAWREQSRRLLDEPELRYWILTEDWVQAFLPQLQEAQTSRLVLNPLQKEERFPAIVRDAVKKLCSGANGRAFKRRMEDMALYFLETKRADQAKLSLAVALQVGEGDPGPLDVSFLTGLMQKSFAYFMSQEKAKKEEEQESLIIKP